MRLTTSLFPVLLPFRKSPAGWLNTTGAGTWKTQCISSAVVLACAAGALEVSVVVPKVKTQPKRFQKKPF